MCWLSFAGFYCICLSILLRKWKCPPLFVVSKSAERPCYCWLKKIARNEAWNYLQFLANGIPDSKPKKKVFIQIIIKWRLRKASGYRERFTTENYPYKPQVTDIIVIHINKPLKSRRRWHFTSWYFVRQTCIHPFNIKEERKRTNDMSGLSLDLYCRTLALTFQFRPQISLLNGKYHSK